MEIYRKFKNLLNIPEQIVFCMYTTRILESFKKSYTSSPSGRNSNLLAQNGIQMEDSSSVKLKADGRMWHLEQTFNLESLGISTRKAKVMRILTYYERISTYLFVFVAIKFILPLESIMEATFELEKPANCYIPGRMVILFVPIVEPLAFLMAMFHLSWRWVQHETQNHYNFSVIKFILEPARNVQLYCATMEAENCNYRPSQDHKYLRDIISYPVRINSLLKYKIRSNRTPEAWSLLEYQVNRCSVIIWFCYVSMVIFFVPILFAAGSSDIWYMNNYPGCNPELEQYSKLVNLGLWSFTPNYHRLSMMVFDFIESLIIWIDSCAAILFIIPLTYFINYDVVFCWGQLHKRLEIIIREFRKEGTLDSQHNDSSEYARMRHFRFGTYGSYSSLSNRISKSYPLENIIEDLQMEIYDCFMQIEAADRLMSDILTFSLMYWFGSVALIQYYVDYSNGSLFLRIAQLYGLFMVTLLNAYPLSLHRTTCRSYKLICSLMAYDQSRHKVRFGKLLEFYSKRNRSTYTLFHQYRYAPTTYLTVVGWTISLAIIVAEKFA